MMQASLTLAYAIPILWLAYTARVLLIARNDWGAFSPDTKAFYLLVAPPMSLATDIVLLSDRLFYSTPRRGTEMP